MAITGRNLLVVFSGEVGVTLADGREIPMTVKLSAWTDQVSLELALAETQARQAGTQVAVEMQGFPPERKSFTVSFRLPGTETEVAYPVSWIRVTGGWFCLLADFSPKLPEGEEVISFVLELLRAIAAKTFPDLVREIKVPSSVAGPEVIAPAACGCE